MNRFRWLTVLMCAFALLIVLPGCSDREHRKVRVHEEEHHGEVEEAPQGEMVVE